MPVAYVDIQDSDDVGQRIDNYLLRSLKGCRGNEYIKFCAPVRCGLMAVG